MLTLFQRLFDLLPSALEQSNIIANGTLEQRAHLAQQLNLTVEDCLRMKHELRSRRSPIVLRSRNRRANRQLSHRPARHRLSARISRCSKTSLC